MKARIFDNLVRILDEAHHTSQSYARYIDCKLCLEKQHTSDYVKKIKNHSHNFSKKKFLKK